MSRRSRCRTCRLDAKSCIAGREIALLSVSLFLHDGGVRQGRTPLFVARALADARSRHVGQGSAACLTRLAPPLCICMHAPGASRHGVAARGRQVVWWGGDGNASSTCGMVLSSPVGRLWDGAGALEGASRGARSTVGFVADQGVPESVKWGRWPIHAMREVISRALCAIAKMCSVR